MSFLSRTLYHTKVHLKWITLAITFFVNGVLGLWHMLPMLSIIEQIILRNVHEEYDRQGILHIQIDPWNTENLFQENT